VDAVVAAHALPVRLRQPLPWPALQAAMLRDKKVRAGAPRFIVLQRLGTAATKDDVPLALAETCFRDVGAA
jgi:3-dehydroquinate synthetase